MYKNKTSTQLEAKYLYTSIVVQYNTYLKYYVYTKILIQISKSTHVWSNCVYRSSHRYAYNWWSIFHLSNITQYRITSIYLCTEFSHLFLKYILPSVRVITQYTVMYNVYTVVAKIQPPTNFAHWFSQLYTYIKYSSPEADQATCVNIIVPY